jgi:thioredoxin reductase (NADPH)
LALTTEVENFPGFPAGDLEAYLDAAIAKDKRMMMPPHAKEGVSGPELMELMRQQAVNFGTRVITDDVVEVDFDTHPFRLTASDGTVQETCSVIVATGARANYLGLPSEEKYKNRGVSACAVCDGALPRFRERPLAVVGGGDSAVEEADYLSKFAGTVYMIHRRDELRASKILQERLFANPKVEVVWDTVVHEVKGGPSGVASLDLENVRTGERRELAVTGFFVFIGFTPNSGLVKQHVAHDPSGYLLTDDRMMTSIPGLFAAGDLRVQLTRQVTTAVGDATTAAIAVEKYLAERKDRVGV